MRCYCFCKMWSSPRFSRSADMTLLLIATVASVLWKFSWSWSHNNWDIMISFVNFVLSLQFHGHIAIIAGQIVIIASHIAIIVGHIVIIAGHIAIVARTMPSLPATLPSLLATLPSLPAILPSLLCRLD